MIHYYINLSALFLYQLYFNVEQLQYFHNKIINKIKREKVKIIELT